MNRFERLGRLHGSKPLIALALALTVTAASLPAQAVKVEASENVWFDFHYLLQTHAVFTSYGEAPAGSPDFMSDFLVKRSRLGIKGQVSPYFGFFLGTGGDPNFGSFDVWDAVAWAKIDKAFIIDSGLVLLPFVHHAQQFSRDLHTLDFLTSAFKYPAGSHFKRRDVGVRFRGLLFDDLVDYRIAVTDGKTGTEDDIPRFTGRVGINFFDAEPGYVLGGTYLGKKKVLSVGAAFDVQPDIVQDADGGAETYFALGGDVYWDLPMGPNRLSGQVDVMYYNGINGKDADGNPVVVDKSALAVIFDVGYAFGNLEPVFALEWYKPEGADEFDDQLMGVHVGLNWWLYGLAANLKLDIGLVKNPGQEFGDAARVVTLQLQTRLP